MARVITQSTIQLARLTNIVKHKNAAGYTTLTITDRRCGTFDVELIAIAPNQQCRPYRFNRTITPNRYGQRVFERLTGLFMEGTKNFIDGTSARIVNLPACQLLRDRIDVLNNAITIRRDDAVTNRLQRNLRAFLFPEQRVFVKFAFRDIDLNTEQAQQTTIFVENGFGTALHPAPVTALVLHTMNGFKKRRLTCKMFTHLRLHACDVVRMHEAIPIEYDILVIGVITKHGFPASRQVNALGIAVKIPDAIIRGHRDQRVTFLQLIEHFTIANSFHSDSKRRSKQLHQQMQVGVPTFDGTLIGQTKKTCNLSVHAKANNQCRTNMNLVEAA